MIFTGVTGGEIVSMLYPLFILSPFCYIIISKESLDGNPSFCHWLGVLQSTAEMPTACKSLWPHFSSSDDFLRRTYGQPGCCSPGGFDVWRICGSHGFKKDL